MNQIEINEIQHQRPTFNVYIEKEIEDYIEYIHMRNEYNTTGLSQFDNYLDGIRRNLSRWDVAFDYGMQCDYYPNDKMYLNYYGWYIGYEFKSDNEGKTYVSIFDLKPNLEELGLRENKSHYILDNIISETINNYLRKYLLIA